MGTKNLCTNTYRYALMSLAENYSQAFNKKCKFPGIFFLHPQFFKIYILIHIYYNTAETIQTHPYESFRSVPIKIEEKMYKTFGCLVFIKITPSKRESIEATSCNLANS